MRSIWTAWVVVVVLGACPRGPTTRRCRSHPGDPGLPAGTAGRTGLADLRGQLSATAYVRWEQAGEVQASMVPGKTQPVSLPAGGTVSVKLVEARQGAATFEVSAPGSRTQSRVTVPPGKRIVQQVSAEQGGSAWFVTIKAGG